tara:strand:- start:4560 stop:5072 length:513 start_codon:yes stop_codon:yes gene_type:complete
MNFDKKGVMGEGIFMIYRLMLITFIALIILGVSSVFYTHYIDVRDAEARIMAREVVNCVASESLVDLSKFPADIKNNFLINCGFDGKEVERFFVKVNITDDLFNSIRILSYGDSGALWVKELFKKKFELKGEILKYEPGYFIENYSVSILKDQEKINGKIIVEVLVSDEF